MDKKIKLLLVVLGLISLLGAGLSAWIYFSAQEEIIRYEDKYSELEKNNAYLRQGLDVAEKESRQWREKAELVTATLNELSQKFNLLQQQYVSLNKEKDSLFDENKSLLEQLEKMKGFYSKVQEERLEIIEKVEVDASDEFLSSLLKEKAALQVEIEKLRGQIESVKKQIRPSQNEFVKLELEKGSVEKKLSDMERASGLLSSDLLQERKKRSSLEEELVRTEGRLYRITQEKDKLAEQLTKMKQALEKRLLELSDTKKVLESAVEGAKKAMQKTDAGIGSIELSPIVVKAEPPKKEAQEIAPPAKEPPKKEVQEKHFTIEGRIITINDKHKFVVIDIGRDAGVEKKMPFSVYRQDKEVGKIEVIEARKNIAACDIKEMKVKNFEINDSVRR
ncbi:MAG: hypothetical protein JSV30_06295 [Candidatus Omnitrophota bacterium]|nr:MAG: hypothetical protein JSV30_06295 [Candidatus Omnitrophota bacterium]